MSENTQPGEVEEITVHQLAQDIRHRGIEKLGEKEFAKTLLALAQAITGEAARNRLNIALTMLRCTTNIWIHQLVIIWLDGAGFGSAKIPQLLAQVEQVQKQYPEQTPGERLD